MRQLHQMVMKVGEQVGRRLQWRTSSSSGGGVEVTIHENGPLDELKGLRPSEAVQRMGHVEHDGVLLDATVVGHRLSERVQLLLVFVLLLLLLLVQGKKVRRQEDMCWLLLGV